MSGLNDEEKRVSIEAFMALGVCKELAEAAAGLGWKTPSAIQEQAIPHLLSGEKESNWALLPFFSPCSHLIAPINHV